MPLISLVVAMARNHVIGRDNGLPWRLPADLKHFKSVTWGKPILMGRKTFESIGKPLPGRANLVLTRDRGWLAPAGVLVAHALDEALGYAHHAPEVAGIGGAEVFRLLMPLATRIHLTRIDADIPGDTVFPSIDPTQWEEVESRQFAADERNAFDMRFVTLERVRAAAR
ncbi:MAG: dihydrofolate reductase [Steroidobacteraceae bacterium]